MRPQIRQMKTPLVVAVVGIALAVGGCASHHKYTGEEQPHPVEVEVNNNLAVPTEVTVWLVQTTGTRQMLGSVPGTETKTFKFTPITFSQEYRLVGERQLQRPLVSQPFTVGSPATGLLIWSLLENIIAFREFDIDSMPAATTKP
jgi:hypothetical protein